MSQEIYDLLIRNKPFRIAFGFIIALTVLSFFYVLISATLYFIEKAMIAATPRSSFFTYEKVDFVTREGNYLVFASTREVNASYPLYFNDILRCNNGETFRFYSHADTNNQHPSKTFGYRKLEWNYNKPFPVGERCYLESNIRMDVKGISKEQQIISDTFTVKE